MDLVDHLREHFESRLGDYLEFHREMVEINSFTANASGVNKLGKYTAKAFERLGFSAEFVPSQCDQYGKHLFLSHKGQGGDELPTLALISHLDTVFPKEEEIQHQFQWHKEGDRIFGPGAVDIKGGTVVLYMVMEALKKFASAQFDQVHWLICINASEEQLTEDFGQRCLERLPQHTLACLVFEGGMADDTSMQIVTSRKGRATFDVLVEGKSAHAGNYHAKGANAVVQMAHTILDIANLTDYTQKLTFNVGKTEGGVVMNRVPHQARTEVEMRAFSSEVFKKGIADMLALDGISNIKSRDGYKCKVSIKKDKETAPWPPNEKSDWLFEYWRKAGQQMALDVVQESRGGLSDGNWLWQHFPTIDGLGPKGENSHCSERDPANGKEQEFVLKSSFVPKAILNSLAIIELVDHKGGNE